MADTTNIEWTDATWNPITGCSLASPGCTNCYAMQLAGTRLRHHWSRKGLTIDTKAGPVWTGETRFNEEWLDQPLKWTRPRMIFVCAHGDLFHESVPDEWIDRVFAVMALAPQHTFQVLTKRSARMQSYIAALTEEAHNRTSDRITAAVNYAMLRSGRNWGRCGSTSTHITTIIAGRGAREPSMLRGTGDGGVERLVAWRDGEQWSRCADAFAERLPIWMKRTDEFGWNFKEWPLPNVWLGVSVEDQARADERIPDLLATPAAVRWLSCEPLLGPVDLEQAWHGENALDSECWGDCAWCGKGFPPLHNCQSHRQSEAVWEKGRSGLDWIVAGGESGPGARPMHPDWARSLRDQCQAAGVPFFFKQWGDWAASGPHNRDMLIGASASVEHPRFEIARVPNSPKAGQTIVTRVGKKAAGRLLDGVEHNGMPA